MSKLSFSIPDGFKPVTELIEDPRENLQIQVEGRAKRIERATAREFWDFLDGWLKRMTFGKAEISQESPPAPLELGFERIQLYRELLGMMAPDRPGSQKEGNDDESN